MSRIVLAHTPRHPPPWLIFDVRQNKMKNFDIRHFIVVVVTHCALHATEATATMPFRDPGAPPTPGKAEIRIREAEVVDYELLPAELVSVIMPNSPPFQLPVEVSVLEAIQAAGGISRITSKHAFSIIT